MSDTNDIIFMFTMHYINTRRTALFDAKAELNNFKRNNPKPNKPSTISHEFYKITGFKVYMYSRIKNIPVHIIKQSREYKIAETNFYTKRGIYNDWNKQYNHYMSVITKNQSDIDETIYENMREHCNPYKMTFIGTDIIHNGSNGDACIMCEERVAKTIAPHCGHIIGCFKCTNQPELKRCPFCRSPLRPINLETL